jgi:hypothetical protein
MGFLKDDQTILVGLAKVTHHLLPSCSSTSAEEREKGIGAKWSRVTCLAAPQNGTGTHQTLAPGNLQRMALTQQFLVQAKHQ